MKIVKTVSWFIGGAIALVILLAIAIPFFVDLNDYKPYIASEVKEATGRDLTINGDIKVSVFPWLGAQLHDVKLSNATNFGPEPFVTFKSADVKVKLVPLLSKKVEIATILLEGLALNLEKSTTGVTNWQDLTQAKPETPKREVEKTDLASALSELAIEGIKIKEATINWTDHSKNSRQSLQGLNISTSAIRLDKPITLQLDFDINSNKPPIKGHVELTTQLALNLSEQQHRLTNTKLTATLLNTVSGLKTTTILTVQALLDLAKQRYTLDNIVVDIRASGGAFPKEIPLQLKSAAIVDLEAQTLTMADFSLHALNGIQVRGALSGMKILDSPTFKGSLAVAPFNPTAILQQFNIALPPHSDSNVFRTTDLTTTFSATPSDITLDPLLVHFDQTTLKGNVSVRNFTAPALKFDLQLDTLDADRYLPTPVEKQVNAPTPPPTPQASKLPLEQLRNLNLDGNFRADAFKIHKLRTQNIHAKIIANKGVIQLKPLSVNLYGGTYHGTVDVDARGNTLKISTTSNAQNIQAGSVLKDYMGKDILSGAANVSAQLGVEGIKTDEFLPSLGGTIEFKFLNGAIQGFNIAKSIRKAKAKLRGQTPPAETEVLQTDFSELMGAATVTNGIINTEKLEVKTPLLRVEGKGKTNLVTQALDHAVTATIVSTIKGQGGADLEDLKGIPIPVKIGGTFNAPTIKLDLKSLYEERAKAKIDEGKAALKEKLDKEKAAMESQFNEKKQQQQQQLKEKAKQQLNDKLKKLF